MPRLSIATIEIKTHCSRHTSNTFLSDKQVILVDHNHAILPMNDVFNNMHPIYLPKARYIPRYEYSAYSRAPRSIFEGSRQRPANSRCSSDYPHVPIDQLDPSGRSALYICTGTSAFDRIKIRKLEADKRGCALLGGRDSKLILDTYLDVCRYNTGMVHGYRYVLI